MRDWRADSIAAWGGALGLLTLELIAVLLLGRAQLASVWELQFGLGYLAPALLACAAVAGLLGLATLRALDAPRAVLPACIGLAASAVAWGVGGGRHLATLPARGGFALLVGVAAAALGWAAAPAVRRWLSSHPGPLGVGMLLGALGLMLLDRTVLVRLYPAFHLALQGLALLSASLGAVALARGARERPSRRSGWALGLLAAGTALAVAALVPSSKRLGHFDNFRLLLSERGQLSSSLVHGSALISPPPALRDGLCDGPGCVAIPTAPSALDWRDRDILLVTIDALRADHVGSYGYPRATTPHLDALAREGALFEYAYAATPHTSYSITSLMTGKYMRPLLLQGAGQDSDTWASLLRTYGYRTAAFYPPAVFFIDAPRFELFSSTFLGFEYRKVEFLEGPPRVEQVRRYLTAEPAEKRQFLWVHLFAPHEPYEAHSDHAFGPRDVDRYDSEIAFADRTLGSLVRLFREHRPQGVVIVTADHGEEFGDHGGRYHGTTVYEEQVRVPLVVSAPGSVARTRVTEVVQTIDLLPTVLGALRVPRPPRLRGRDLGGLLAAAGTRSQEPGFALAETEQQVLVANGPHRLICERRLGACRLFDVARDPRQLEDRSRDEASVLRALRERLRELGASHGRFEVQGLRAEGRGWPAAILRGASGDGEAAEELAALLDDADRAVRRKAAELLFELRRPETAPALRLALGRDEDDEVRRWCALALTRLDQGAPLVVELLRSSELRWRRLAALSLAESGDPRGASILVEWWKDASSRDYDRSRELLAAFAHIRSKDAVWPLTLSLGDVRLRPFIAETLATIGEPGARISLARAFAEERYQGSRVALASAIVTLGGGPEIAPSLIRFLGVPDPMHGGLELATRAGLLQALGGPSSADLERLRRRANLGTEVLVSVPKGGNGTGVRVLVRARSRQDGATLVLATPLDTIKYDRKGEPIKLRDHPRLDLTKSLRLPVPKSEEWLELHAPAPESLGARPGRPVRLVVFTERGSEIDSLALVPLADELPPPAPEPWQPGDP